MSRLLLLGEGRFAAGDESLSPGVAQRAWRLGWELAGAGHQVCVADCSVPYGAPMHAEHLSGGGYDIVVWTPADSGGRNFDQLNSSFQPQAIIAVGGKAALFACRTCAELPLWVDLPENILELAQVRADEDEFGADYLHAKRENLLVVLRRADVFSCLSDAQGYALIGQLGLAGRINRHTVEYSFLYGIPVLAPRGLQDVRREPCRPPAISIEDLAVAFAPHWSPNPDLETLAAALAWATEQNPRIVLVVLTTDSLSEDRNHVAALEAACARPGHAVRRQLVMVPDGRQEAQVLAGCDLAICPDRLSYEAVMAARAWVVGALGLGVPVVVTRGSAFAEMVERSGSGYCVPMDSPRALADVIVHAAVHRQALVEMGTRGRALVESLPLPTQALAPLFRWAETPWHAPDWGTAYTNAGSNALPAGGLRAAGGVR